MIERMRWRRCRTGSGRVKTLTRARVRRHTSNYKGAAEVVKRKETNEVDSDGISKKNCVKLLENFLSKYFSRFLNIKERVQTRDQEVEGRCR